MNDTDTLKILRWVSKYMPVSVNGKEMYLHAAALLDPTEEYCLACDKNPYEKTEEVHEVTVTLVRTKDIKLLI